MVQASVMTTLDHDIRFEGQNATAAIAAVRAHKMIDAVGHVDGGSDVRLQIPYTSVLALQFRYVPDEDEPVEDDNCKVRTPEIEPGPEPEPEPGPDPDAPVE